jgi:hypothetical protein
VTERAVVAKIVRLLQSDAVEKQIAAALVLAELGVRDAAVVEGAAGAAGQPGGAAAQSPWAPARLPFLADPAALPTLLARAQAAGEAAGWPSPPAAASSVRWRAPS